MLDLKDKALLDSLVGSRVIKFEFSKTHDGELQLDGVILEKCDYSGEQCCVYADNCDDLGIVKYK